MRLKLFTRLKKRRSAVDLAVDAYIAWRGECVAVRNAYVVWRRARGEAAAIAFDAYEAALDREELAATVYSRFVTHVGQAAELGLARQLAYSAVAPGAGS